MPKIAPHLPAQACSINTHTRWAHLRWMVAIVAVAILAGSVSALMVVDRWYPVGVNGGTILTPAHDTALNSDPLDPAIVREWRYRIINLYDESKLAHGVYYTDSAQVGQAVIINAGGWAVVRQGNASVKAGVTTAVDFQGTRYLIEKVIADNQHNLLYIKITGSNFRATTAFAPATTIASKRIFWGLAEADWRPYTVGEKELASTNGTYSIFSEPVHYSLRELGASNQVLITSRGEFVGFSNDVGTIIPAWTVEYVLPNIITTGAPTLARFDWVGAMVTGARDGNSTKEVIGFYVADIKTKEISTIKKNDVVVRIQGELADHNRLMEQIISAPAEFMVDVLRDGKTVQLKIKK